MAPRKKNNEVPIEDLNDDFSSLLAGTGFNVIKDFKVLNNNRKIPTPIEILNCMLGGGIPFGTVLNSFGRSKTGKSTWLYQMMALFQQRYPEGICFIIDTETSGDPERARFFGVDTDRVMIICPPSIESGFLSIMKMLENKAKNDKLKDKPVFGIWDSLSNGLAQDGSTQSRMNAQDRARVIKNYMGPLMAEIEKHEFFLGCINQVVRQTDAYGNSKDISGGGVALEHQVHIQTKFTRTNSDSYEGNYLTQRVSMMSLDKSKVSPEMSSIAVVMDITMGGMIDEISSFIYYMTIDANGFIPNSKGWYRLDNIMSYSKDKFYYKYLYDYNKSYRYNELLELAREDKFFYNLLRLVFMDRMSSIYKLQSKIIEPYMIETINKMRETVLFPELSLADDEEYRSRVIDNLMNDRELLDRVKETIDSGAEFICLNCGMAHEDMYGCECNSDGGVVVSSKLALYVIAKSGLDSHESDEELVSVDDDYSGGLSEDTDDINNEDTE